MRRGRLAVSFGAYAHTPLHSVATMSDPIQRRLLERELELMSFFGLGIAADLRSADPESQLTLVRGLFAVSLKLSRLLWPFGRRAGDDLAVREAIDLRARLGIDDGHPLSPERSPPLAAALRLDSDNLRSVLDLERQLLTLEGRAYPLARLIDAIREVHREVSGAAPASGDDE